MWIKGTVHRDRSGWKWRWASQGFHRKVYGQIFAKNFRASPFGKNLSNDIFTQIHLDGQHLSREFMVELYVQPPFTATTTFYQSSTRREERLRERVGERGERER